MFKFVSNKHSGAVHQPIQSASQDTAQCKPKAHKLSFIKRCFASVSLSKHSELKKLHCESNAVSSNTGSSQALNLDHFSVTRASSIPVQSENEKSPQVQKNNLESCSHLPLAPQASGISITDSKPAPTTYCTLKSDPKKSKKEKNYKQQFVLPAKVWQFIPPDKKQYFFINLTTWNDFESWVKTLEQVIKNSENNVQPSVETDRLSSASDLSSNPSLQSLIKHHCVYQNKPTVKSEVKAQLKSQFNSNEAEIPMPSPENALSPKRLSCILHDQLKEDLLSRLAEPDKQIVINKLFFPYGGSASQHLLSAASLLKLYHEYQEVKNFFCSPVYQELKAQMKVEDCMLFFQQHGYFPSNDLDSNETAIYQADVQALRSAIASPYCVAQHLEKSQHKKNNLLPTIDQINTSIHEELQKITEKALQFPNDEAAHQYSQRFFEQEVQDIACKEGIPPESTMDQPIQYGQEYEEYCCQPCILPKSGNDVQISSNTRVQYFFIKHIQAEALSIVNTMEKKHTVYSLDQIFKKAIQNVTAYLLEQSELKVQHLVQERAQMRSRATKIVIPNIQKQYPQLMLSQAAEKAWKYRLYLEFDAIMKQAEALVNSSNNYTLDSALNAVLEMEYRKELYRQSWNNLEHYIQIYTGQPLERHLELNQQKDLKLKELPVEVINNYDLSVLSLDLHHNFSIAIADQIGIFKDLPTEARTSFEVQLNVAHENRKLDKIHRNLIVEYGSNTSQAPLFQQLSTLLKIQEPTQNWDWKKNQAFAQWESRAQLPQDLTANDLSQRYDKIKNQCHEVIMSVIRNNRQWNVLSQEVQEQLSEEFLTSVFAKYMGDLMPFITMTQQNSENSLPLITDLRIKRDAQKFVKLSLS